MMNLGEGFGLSHHKKNTDLSLVIGHVQPISMTHTLKDHLVYPLPLLPPGHCVLALFLHRVLTIEIPAQFLE